MTLKEVAVEIETRTGSIVLARMTTSGVVVGVRRSNGEYLQSLLPIDDESRPRFADFMVKKFTEMEI